MSGARAENGGETTERVESKPKPSEGGRRLELVCLEEIVEEEGPRGAAAPWRLGEGCDWLGAGARD